MVDRSGGHQVGYDESLDIVLPLIHDVVQELDGAQEWATRLLEEPVVAGVESMTVGVVTVRITAKWAPNESLPVSRETREWVKTAFDAARMRAPQVMPPLDGAPGGSRT